MTVTKFWGAPGTGKTTRLIQEINTLLSQGYEKSDFIVCTFRRVMADELKEKLAWDTKKGEGIVNTIHGVCRVLAEIKGVVTEKHKIEFCEAVALAYHKENDNPEAEDSIPIITAKSTLGNLFFDAQSFLTNNMLGYSDIIRYNEITKLEKLVPHAAEFMRHAGENYIKWKKENNLADFDDMLSTVHEQELSPNTKVLVVDEFQDLTPLQYMIIRMWAENMEQVLIAGDPRQTLYSYRGASSVFFEEHEGGLVVLDTTHRLPENIWNYAQKILKRANLSSPEIKTRNRIGVLRKITESAYYERLPSFKEDTLHIVRINEMGVKIAQALAKAGIPFRGISGWGNEQINLYNAIIKVRKGIAGEEVQLSADELDMVIEIYPADNFAAQKTTLRKQFDTKKTFNFNEVRAWASLDIYGKRKLWHKIAGEVFEDALKAYRDPESLRHIKIIHALKNHGKVIDRPSVVLSTIHGAKGAEAKFVFLHDEITKKIAEQLYSEYRTDAIEAEANVFYVGATRAIQALFIVESNREYRYALPDAEREG